MAVLIIPHAMERLAERGIREEEIRLAVSGGERTPAKQGRTMFRRNFPFDGMWLGRSFRMKQVEVIAQEEGDDWVVVTAIARYW